MKIKLEHCVKAPKVNCEVLFNKIYKLQMLRYSCKGAYSKVNLNHK